MSSISQNIDLFSKFLNLRSANHEIISSNVANSETPFYKARIPQFRAKLEKAQNIVDGLEIFGGKQNEWNVQLKVAQSNKSGNENGNNVDRRAEMAAMAENSMMYMSTIKFLNRELALARYAIQGS